MPQRIEDLPTPALLLDAAALERNLTVLAKALPGARLRPHVKAHKCTELARQQRAHGHANFTCATIREMEGMAAAGLGEDLLLANEVLDTRRLGALDARVTVAVDSEETVRAAVDGGVREVLVDVNVGLPRCGCPPERAGDIAAAARAAGLTVRGVMGYEGHCVGLPDQAEREKACEASMQLLLAAHADVGGDVISAGGTGTYACNTWATEIQAGSYALMDTAYSALELPLAPALSLSATVISVSQNFAVADCGLKALGMDHGNPTTSNAAELPEVKVWFCSDEHITFAAQGDSPRVGDRIRVIPAHVDPTVAYHEKLHLIGEDGVVLESWPIDLRGW